MSPASRSDWRGRLSSASRSDWRGRLSPASRSDWRGRLFPPGTGLAASDLFLVLVSVSGSRAPSVGGSTPPSVGGSTPPSTMITAGICSNRPSPSSFSSCKFITSSSSSSFSSFFPSSTFFPSNSCKSEVSIKLSSFSFSFLSSSPSCKSEVSICSSKSITLREDDLTALSPSLSFDSPPEDIGLSITHEAPPTLCVVSQATPFAKG